MDLSAILMPISAYLGIGVFQLLALWAVRDRPLTVFEAVFIIILWPYLWLVTWLSNPKGLMKVVKAEWRMFIKVYLFLLSLGFLLWLIVTNGKG